MNKLIRLTLILAFTWLAACSSSDDAADTGEMTGMEPETMEPESMEPDSMTPDPDADNPPPTPGAAQTAEYRLTFNATWSAATHPLLFPGNPHFSGLTGAVHNSQVIFWERGQIASGGIELMAETGASSMLLDEVAFALGEGHVLAEIAGGGVATSPGSREIEFTVSTDYPLVTVTTMLAPSPDWFVGVNSLSLIDGDGAFVEQMTIDLVLYDSGTDSGLRYTSSNADTQPREIIQPLTADAMDAPFVEGLPSVGQFVIEKI